VIVTSFTHAVSGVTVTVADGKELGPDWVEAGEETQKRSPGRPKKLES
jgi:hypothetical protein